MVLGDGEAYFGVCLEPSVFVHEDDIWRFEGVLIGQQNLSVVESLVEFCVFWSLEGEVPGVEVTRQRLSLQVGQFLLVELPDLS